MNFFDAANHWLIYLLVIIGIAYVTGFSIISMRKSWKRAIAKGYSREKLMNLVKMTVSTTIVPSISIVIGLFSLVALIGIPWPWWRLSVVGALPYETMAADSAIKAAGLDMTRLAEATARDFVLVMFVMSIGIMGGMFVSPFITKPIQLGSMNMKAGDKRWAALGGSVFFMVILSVFVVPLFLNWRTSGYIQMLTLVTSMVITIILNRIATGPRAFLRNFVLAISLILAMASSVLWNALLT
ncbi:DUF5058 domain-containing protein [Spirochaetia bacterium]|nr:DUF5058 domain-containing protein [Spirochaetia bacterium]